MPDLFSRQPPGPMRPWEYLRLRRLAAGLKIEQAAAPHWKRPEHQADVERTLRGFEEVGRTIRQDYVVRAIVRSFPFDPDVYIALRDCTPEHQPTVCRGCGCTPWDLPTNRDGTEATILPHLVCTACEEKRGTVRDSAIRRAAA